MKQFLDIRVKDKVRLFNNLTIGQKEKISKFAVRMNDYDSTRRSLNETFKRGAENALIFEVIGIFVTRKTNTPFVRIFEPNFRITLNIQSRYLKVLIREPKHPLTNVFL